MLTKGKTKGKTKMTIQMIAADLSTVNAEEYQGWHDAPMFSEDTPVNGWSLEDFSEAYPGDLKYYIQNVSRETLDSIRSAADMVKVYRVAPAGTQTINAGDWVGLSLEYAQTHARNRYDGTTDGGAKAVILTALVKKSELCTEGNGLEEWAYSPAV